MKHPYNTFRLFETYLAACRCLKISPSVAGWEDYCTVLSPVRVESCNA